MKYRLFSDVTTVSRGGRIVLKNRGYLDNDDTVTSWRRLAPALTSRRLAQTDAKGLILIELEQPEPREEILRRLVSYLAYSEKEKTLEAIEKLLKPCPENQN